MASVFSSVSCSKFAIIMMILFLQSQAQLHDTNDNEKGCADVPNIIREIVDELVRLERSVAAYLLRLHFNDCFVGGCDASLLLDGPGERDAVANGNLGPVFQVIEFINSRIETVCPLVFSCTDILAIAARDASVEIGGPSWPVKTGRLDAKKPETRAAVESNFPKFNGNVAQVKDVYFRKNFTERELVALIGRRTIGTEKCGIFRERVNGRNLSEIDPEFAREVRESVPCPADGSRDENLRSFDSDNLDIWDNNFYQTLLAKSALLDSDQALYSGSTGLIIDEYVRDPFRFWLDFSNAMFKVSELSPITDPKQGEIRKVCSTPNDT